MGELVNLNRRRKERAKQAAQAEAAANRAKHGRTKAEKQADRLAETQRQALLDGAKRESPRD